MSEIPTPPLNRNNLTHGISALVNKKARLLGEIDAHHEKIASLKSDIKVLDRAMTILEPETSEEVLQPKPKRTVKRHFKAGELKKAILNELRRSEKPLTIRELAITIEEKKKIEKKITDNVKHSVTALHKEKLIVLQDRSDTYEKAYVIA